MTTIYRLEVFSTMTQVEDDPDVWSMRHHWRLIRRRGGKIVAGSVQGRGYSRAIDAERAFEQIMDARLTDVEIVRVDQ